MANTALSPAHVPSVNPADAEVAPGVSPLASLRAALTFASKAEGSTPASLDDAVLLASLAASLGEVADKIAKLAKGAILDAVPAGEAHEVRTPSGTIKALVVAPHERKAEDHRAAAEALRERLRAAALDLAFAGFAVAAEEATAAASAPAPVKVSRVGASVRLS